MRLLHWLLALAGALLLGAWLAPYLGEDPGYVLVRVHGWAFETTATALALAALIVLAAWQVVAWVLRTPRRALRRILEKRREARLEKGLLALAEGRWARAEKLLAADARHSGMPAVHYLLAARAAQGRGDEHAREHYLALADESGAANDPAVSLTRAEMLIADGETETAAAVLEMLRETEPRNERALQLLAQCYEALGRWDELTGLLPALRRVAGLDHRELERRALCGRFAAAGDARSLEGAWSSMPRRARSDPAVAAAWAERALTLGDDTLVAQRLPGLLRRRWDPMLVRLFGRAAHPEAARALKTAEGWLKKHPDDPALLLTLGRLCRQAGLPGKARHYLERSLARAAAADAYRELAQLLEDEGDTAAALSCYRNLLHLRRHEPVEPVPFERYRRLDAPGTEPER